MNSSSDPPTTRKLPAKKRHVNPADYDRFASSDDDDSSDASSASFQMEEPSSDEEEEGGGDYRVRTFQALPPMNSQATSTSISFSPTLATQPPLESPRTKITDRPPSKKRKVSLSPTDSLAKRRPETIIIDPLEEPSPVHLNRKKTTPVTKKPVQKKSNKSHEPIVTPKKSDVSSSKKPSKNTKKSKKTAASDALTSHNDTARVTPKPKASETSKAAPKKTLEKPRQAATSSKKAAETSTKAKKPKKKKKKKTFQDELVHHMFFSCKPYTVKGLSQQLKTNDTSVEFCLLSLIDKGWVVKKEFKTKTRSKELYWANQNTKSKELFDALEMTSPDQVGAARRELASLQQQEKAAIRELQQSSQEISNEDLNQQLAAAESNVKELDEKLQATLSRIRAAKQPQRQQTVKRPGLLKQQTIKAKPMCPKRLKTQINKMRDEWRKRKEKCTDFVEQLADGMEKKVKDVIKLLELETDEMAGVKMPPKYVIDKK